MKSDQVINDMYYYMWSWLRAKGQPNHLDGNWLYIKIIIIIFDFPFWFVHLFEANWLKKYCQFKPFQTVDMNWNPWCLMASHGTYICCFEKNCSPFTCHGLGGWDKLHHLCQLIDHNKNGVTWFGAWEIHDRKGWPWTSKN